MSSMQQDDHYDDNSSRAPESNQDGTDGGFQASANLIKKMEKLAKCRIDPSLIEFPKDATDLHGGHATVSRALLKTPSNKSGNTNEDGAQTDAEEKVVAVKKLKANTDKDFERVLGLTVREAGFLVEFSHQHIVKLEGFVENAAEGIIWLVFPWEANGNLRDFVASQDWEIPERICLIDDVARGVDYLHGQHPPICHGDLKSVNILVNSDCLAVITDFGSARRLTEGDLNTETEQVESGRRPATRLEAKFSASSNTITLTGNEFTLRWAAPELLNDEQLTTKVDIWALGWIAYEVMTNAIPFEDVGKDSIVINRVTQGHLPSITGDVRMSLMLQLCCLMSECWSTDPIQRPTATECLKSLRWMPMIIPNPSRTTESMACETRSPRLLLKLGDMHYDQGDYANASKLYTEAMRIFTDVADTKGRAETLDRLGELHLVQGNYEDAIVSYSDALEIFTSTDDKKRKAPVLYGLAKVYRSQSMYTEATTFYSELLEISTDIGDPHWKAQALFGFADVLRARGEYSQAVPLYTDALRNWTDVGNRQGRASALWGLAEVHRLQERSDQAIPFYSDALQIYTDIGDSQGKAFALSGLGDVSSDQGRLKEAIDLYEQASSICERIGAAGIAAYVSKRTVDARRRMELIEKTA